jgi:uncharacterized protein
MKICLGRGLYGATSNFKRWSSANTDQGVADLLISKLKSSSRAAKSTAAVQHVVAFSGGIDSSVVAAAVYRTFPDNSVAVLGVSPSLAASQRQRAREVAEHIGIQLVEINTAEGEKEMYIENEGQACYACKTSLYEGMSWEAVVEWTSQNMEQRPMPHRQNRDGRGDKRGYGGFKIKLYNGTNAEDVQDTTRVGLKAARDFDVSSPLLESGLGKEDVRAVGRAWGLPNWNAAASPCLRSRLALGVRATPSSLRQVELAEDIVRNHLSAYGLLHASTNLRVRHLKSGAAAIELDQHVLDAVMGEDADENRNHEQEQSALKPLTVDGMLASIAALGYTRVDLRPFRSGSVAATSTA